MIPETITEKSFRYTLPKDAWFFKKLEEFTNFLDECKKKLEMENYEIEINHVLLFNIFVRIDERKDYFMYFHSEEDSMHMSLGKEIALEAYWISKYKPLRLKNFQDEIDFSIKFKSTINDVIAVMLIIGFLIDKNEKLDEFFTAKRIDTFIYDMFNRDISKEAMIMYVESFFNDNCEDS